MTQNCPSFSSKTALAKSIVTSARTAFRIRIRESRSLIAVTEVIVM